MPPSNVPVRICGSKVRRGCVTCKKRHIRCNEGRPVCSQCLKFGRLCRYEPPCTDRTKRSARNTGDTSRGLYHGNNPSPYGSMEIEDIQAFGHFLTYAAVELSRPFSRMLWCRVLPIMAHSESSIRHALVAVSIFHTSFQRGASCTVNLSVAQKHYNKAIQSVLQLDRTTRHAYETALMSCVLFAAAQALQGHFRSALSHVSSGLKLFFGQHYRQMRNGNGYLCPIMLQTIFTNLDTQAVELSEVELRSEISQKPAQELPQLLFIFSTPDEANHILCLLRHRLSRLFQWVQPADGMPAGPDLGEVINEREKLASYFAEWSYALDKSSFDSKDPAYHAIIVYKLIIEIFFARSYLGMTEIDWDKLNPMFSQVVDYAETYSDLCASKATASALDQPREFEDSSVSNNKTSANSGRQRPTMTLATDIVMPLYMVRTRCRDPQIRRRSLKILQRCNRREGLWDATFAAHVAERSIGIEETEAHIQLLSSDTKPFGGDYSKAVEIMSCEQIPEKCRIHRQDVRFGAKTTAHIKYQISRMLDNVITNSHGDSNIFEETIEW